VSLPQKVDLGLLDPQSEVEVWLDGLGTRIDVTHRHLMSCGAPLTICIALDRDQAGSETLNRRLALCFHERGGRQQLLGETRQSADNLIDEAQTRGIFDLFDVGTVGGACLDRQLMQKDRQQPGLIQRLQFAEVLNFRLQIHAGNLCRGYELDRLCSGNGCNVLGLEVKQFHARYDLALEVRILQFT